MSRSFTYIDDVIDSIIRLIKKPADIDKIDKFNPNPASSYCPHRIFNIGNNESIELEKIISYLEKEIGINAIKEYKDMQIDVKETKADNSNLKNGLANVLKPPDMYKKFYNLVQNFYKY